jgi:hypothetical protein
VQAVFQKNEPSHHKALFRQSPADNSPKGFEMASINIYTNCKPYTRKKSIEKWVKKNIKGAPVRKPLLLF